MSGPKRKLSTTLMTNVTSSNLIRMGESGQESPRAHVSLRPNKSKSLNSWQLFLSAACVICYSSPQYIQFNVNCISKNVEVLEKQTHSECYYVTVLQLYIFGCKMSAGYWLGLQSWALHMFLGCQHESIK